MKEKTMVILNKDIDVFLLYYDFKSQHASNGLHVIIGKIAMSVELGIITFDEMDLLIDLLFQKYALLKDK